MTIESILPIPDIFSAKRMLSIQPHYDDNDIAAAGTLVLLQQNGAEQFYLTVTDDLMGVVDHSLSNGRTLMLANAVMILGIGLGGLVLIGDVIMTEVFDGDEVKTGHQRAGMYFGSSGFLITLSGLLVSSVFGLLMPAFGYDTLLDVQPASVDLGFRIFLTVPTSVGFLLAIFLLWLYPLHGDYLKQIKETLTRKQAGNEPAS